MEDWDLYDRYGEKLGKRVESGTALPEGTYRKIVHAWILNENEEFLIQKRASHLKWFPNKWATTTGGVLSTDIGVVSAVKREIFEELGIDSKSINLSFDSDIILGNLIVSIWKGQVDRNLINRIALNDEVADVQWMNKTKIETLRKEDNFARYSQETFDIVYQFKYEQE